MTHSSSKRSIVALVLTVLSTAPFMGCGDELYVSCFPTNIDSGVSASALIDAELRTTASDAAPPSTTDRSGECPAESARRVEVVTGDIAENTTWDCDALYLLGGYVTVKNFATLTVNPGVIVKGDGTSALIITREGKIDARGERTRPIVFSSISAPGTRAPGGWQGLVLLGKGRINVGSRERAFEGLPPEDVDYRYGGTDDAHDCGTLRYVRVEFAGHELQPNKELNSLSVAACGSMTTIDYVQLHAGKDDGIEFFGGTASAKHLVITGADDDSIDWDEGYRGRIQFAAIQQHDLSGAGDSNGIEASNHVSMFSAMPIASPQLYNVTMIGDRASYNQVRAVILKDGTQGELKNLVALGFATSAIDVVTKESADALRAQPPALSLTNSLFFEIGPDGSSYFPAPDSGESESDQGFDEQAHFLSPERANRFAIDPLLPNAYDRSAPGWVPAADSPLASGGATPPDDRFFDRGATYVGAFRPGGEDWTAGWTAYPEN